MIQRLRHRPKTAAELKTEEILSIKLTKKECLIGDSAFYKKVAFVVLPMIAQNTLTNIVGLLDNVMVGQVGTLPMSAVAIVNQILFVFYLVLWGAIAGAGIYGTQFFGKGDHEGVRSCMRFKLIIALLILAVVALLLLIKGDFLISLYIAGSTSEADRAMTMEYALDYMHIMLIGLIPFTFTQCYAGTLRESGHTALPMKAGMTAMAVNFVFNALLIFGLLGFPKLGVTGAAIATVISRFAEFLIVLLSVIIQKKKYSFFTGLYKTLKIPRELVGPILIKTLPLLFGEFLWSFGQAALLRCYSVRGIAVIAAMNICNTIAQIFNEVFLSLGNSSAIIVGQELGADKLLSARKTAWRMMALSVSSCFIMGSLLYLFAPLIPGIYNTENDIRALATSLIRIQSLTMFCFALANVSYFVLRAGGKTVITFLFDALFAWLVTVPVALLLCSYTTLPITLVYFIVNITELIKGFIGIYLVKKGSWIRNIVK
ncbi:MAG: MATE family efflux transporter [Lachnospiraceae bacterium]|nr:MATE family efflux transporter [Lachnospiraceae bacterium]